MRRLVEVSGKDALAFLQGLVTNDVLPLGRGEGIVWTALLTPQGKYLADFFVAATGGRLLLDLPAAVAEDVAKRLAMYRLRADVGFAASDLSVARGVGAPPPGALPDPRHPGLGWRLYGTGLPPEAAPDWDALRVAHGVPETGIELIPGESYILEMGFDRLNGVDFRKGCYVGQEVTARMRHKTELRKGLVRVAVEGEAPQGTPVTVGGREVGVLHTRSGDRALAFLRFDRAEGEMQAGAARVRRVDKGDDTAGP
jgi:hypothetical protein